MLILNSISSPESATRERVLKLSRRMKNPRLDR